ncbi:uncharacterized protein LOC107766389 isoform X2 [Nicotiana tabacum]|uniref:Maf-like protein DDB_G0281937 isoform X2 n=1 Tax=Nicotiana tabacum TaxID=4097 RepID=A0A1S3XKY5_TOBAC|nr:PREDICTED: maf-like protein DDB_G0281937 isoform X2 [Nicotiana tabacum]XP_018628039.1 7-methyl-GTP pyrophosphatase-like isoform X2 [Nicotiana tomentosiformis]
MAPKNLSFKIILGSSSMARRKILADMGYDFTVMTADIDEKSIRKENAEELVVALAEAKADAIMSRLETTEQLEENTHPTLLITADTIFFGYILPTSIGIEVAVYQGIIREKPSSKDEARQFIKSYSGGQATVVGSVVVTNLTKGIRKGAWERSEVYFHEIPDEVIDSLIEEGIILNVAGGLMLEHPLTLPFVDTVVKSNLVGFHIHGIKEY